MVRPLHPFACVAASSRPVYQLNLHNLHLEHVHARDDIHILSQGLRVFVGCGARHGCSHVLDGERERFRWFIGLN